MITDFCAFNNSVKMIDRSCGISSHFDGKFNYESREQNVEVAVGICAVAAGSDGRPSVAPCGCCIAARRRREVSKYRQIE